MITGPAVHPDTADGPTASTVAADLASAVAGRDPRAVAALLTESVRLRALLPRGPIGARGRADAAALLPALIADFDAVEVLASAGEDVADLVHVHYRLGLRRGTDAWVCTQTAVCHTDGGLLARIDLVCSGFRRAS